MGREIRRVPLDWQHPKDGRGNYRPLRAGPFAERARKWLDDAIAWDNGTHPDLVRDPTRKERDPFFQDWDGPSPSRDEYVEYFSEPVAYQVYETVTEGTPVSPVFETEGAIIDWLVGQGRRREDAEAFVRMGWAPSFVAFGGKFMDGIAAAGALEKKD